MAELDVIIGAALTDDAAALRQFIDYTEAPCTTAVGLGGPPKCLAGEPEGTLVEVLPLLGPEGGFIRKADMGSWHGIDASGLFAAYEVSDAAYSDEYYPAGEYALVFTGSPGSSEGIRLQIADGRIIRIDFGPGNPPAITPADVVRYLVTPAPGNP